MIRECQGYDAERFPFLWDSQGSLLSAGIPRGSPEPLPHGAGTRGLTALCAPCFRAGAVRGALLAAARAGGAAPGAGGEGRAAAQPGARRGRGGDALQDGLPPGEQVSRGWRTPGARPARGEAGLQRPGLPERSAGAGTAQGPSAAGPACLSCFPRPLS